MEVLLNKNCSIGEGPIWNEAENRLYHVNAFGGNEICSIDIESGEHKVRKLPFAVSAIGFSKKGEMLVSCADGAYILNDDDSRSPLYDTEKVKIRFGNDAKVGPDGKFYIGTQSSKRKGVGEEIDGKLYSIDKDGNVKILLDGLILSNGFEWSMDETMFYHTDSDTHTIREYTFDKECGEIAFTGRQTEVHGVDGFTIDENDMIYAACWGKGYVAVIDTKDLQVKRYISVPARIPASCCFAGEDMKSLVVVTSNLSGEENGGFTFIEKMDICGRKPYLFG